MKYPGGNIQQAIQSVTVGGTQTTNGLDSHLLSLALTLSYPCPYYPGQATATLEGSNCLVALIQGQVILDGTLAFVPTNQTIIDYNLLVPSGPYNLVVIVEPNIFTYPTQTAATFSAGVVLDDLGEPVTT